MSASASRPGSEIARANRRAACYNHRLERPNRPERHHRSEFIVFANDTLLFFFFDFQVCAQQTGSMCPLKLRQRRLLLCRLIRQRSVRPDLSVRMRIARAHHRAAIFKDQYGIDPVLAPQRLILLGPHIHNRAQSRRRTFAPASNHAAEKNKPHGSFPAPLAPSATQQHFPHVLRPSGCSAA